MTRETRDKLVEAELWEYDGTPAYPLGAAGTFDSGPGLPEDRWVVDREYQAWLAVALNTDRGGYWQLGRVESAVLIAMAPSDADREQVVRALGLDLPDSACQRLKDERDRLVSERRDTRAVIEELAAQLAVPTKDEMTTRAVLIDIMHEVSRLQTEREADET